MALKKDGFGAAWQAATLPLKGLIARKTGSGPLVDMTILFVHSYKQTGEVQGPFRPMVAGCEVRAGVAIDSAMAP